MDAPQRPLVVPKAPVITDIKVFRSYSDLPSVVPADKPDLNVYILGAGFSCDAGAPLLKGFWDTARDILTDPNSGLKDIEKADFQQVFDFRRRVAQVKEKFSIDLDDIEQLFGLIEMSHRLEADASDVRDAMVYLIAKTLQVTVASRNRRPLTRISLHPNYTRSNLQWAQSTASTGGFLDLDIYGHFARLISGQYDDSEKAKSRANVVITFNYDLVLDDALRGAKIEPVYALEHTSIEEPSFAIEKSTGLPLLKLHGSTNWAICASCKRVHILRSKVADPFELRSRKCLQCEHPKLNPLLVPPSWDKSEYREVMRPVWMNAVEALKRAKRICVIGYSMPETDMFFKFLLTLGLAENQQLYRLIVVDLMLPHTENSLEIRYRDMLEPLFQKRRFRFLGHGFAHFLDQGAAAELGRAETILPGGIY